MLISTRVQFPIPAAPVLAKKTVFTRNYDSLVARGAA